MISTLIVLLLVFCSADGFFPMRSKGFDPTAKAKSSVLERKMSVTGAYSPISRHHFNVRAPGFSLQAASGGDAIVSPFDSSQGGAAVSAGSSSDVGLVLIAFARAGILTVQHHTHVLGYLFLCLLVR